LSIGTFCDAGCTATFSATEVAIIFNGKTVLTGKREPPGLWKTTQQPTILQATPEWMANGAFSNQLKSNAVKFLHAACFSPTTATWTKAINHGFFRSWPMLTAKTVRQHLPKSVATAMGHMDQSRKNQRSTKLRSKPTQDEDGWITPTPRRTQPQPQQDREPQLMTGSNATDISEESTYDNIPTTEQPTHAAFANMIELSNVDGKSYSDLTGRFPCKSELGNLYVMVLYAYDANAILVEPIKNRSDSEQLKAMELLIKQANKGTTLKVQWMDNEASTAMKQLLQDKFGMQFQLAPPHMHRINAAERAIRTFKNHFVAGLCSTDPNFPLRLWDRLLPQAEITLNLLRAARSNSKISAHEALHGPFDFNKTPLAPPGIKVIVHEKPGQRNSWDPHGVSGWYLGPAQEHYRCYRTYINKSHAERITDTIEFFPVESHTPTLTVTESAIAAAEALVAALNNTKKPPHFDELITPSEAAIQRLSAIFERPANEQQPPRVVPASTAIPAPRVVVNNSIAQRTRSNTTDEHHETSGEQSNFFANAVFHPETGNAMTYRQLITDPLTKQDWQQSAANEFGRLAQGIGGRVKGTNTIRFIKKQEIPTDRKPTYPRFVCELKPQKVEKTRTRLTLGGNLIDYPGDVSTRTADMDTIKIVLNSTVSTPDARFCSMDITNFYLNTKMDRPEYVRIPIALIPEEVINDYKLRELVDDQGNIYAIVEKGMYGLPQAGILANKALRDRLEPHGYYECYHTPGLWRHKTRPILFALVVDDFAVQYTGKIHAQHLLASLKQNYEAVTIDWDGKLFTGITLDWDYVNRHVTLSMPGYVAAALEEFQHPTPTRREHQPYRHNPPNYGQKIQYTEAEDTTEPLNADGILRIQRITGKFQYYSRAVDPTYECRTQRTRF
jgi:Reverse transcriptase (RNA-dependent DNA polymerase)